MNKNKRKCVGFGKDQNGYLNMGIKTSDFLEIPESKEGFRFITAIRHREIREKGITHMVVEDSFKPEIKKEA